MIIALGFLVVDWRISVGIILGMAFSDLQIFLINKTINTAVSSGENGPGFYRQFFIRLLLMSLPMLMGFMLPEYVNIWGAVGGLMINKAALYIYGVLNKE